MDEVTLQQLENQGTTAQASKANSLANILRAQKGPTVRPGITASEDRLYGAFGTNDALGDPYGKFDDEAIRRQIKAADAGIDAQRLEAAVATAKLADGTARKDQRAIVSAALDDALDRAGELSPDQLISRFEAIVFAESIFLPEDQADRLVNAIAKTGSVIDFGVEARTRMSKFFSLRSGIARIRKRIADPAFAKNLEFISARMNAVTGTFSKRLVDKEVIAAMTELGFTRELLLRAFTGAAAPETEFARFKSDFVGTLTDGPEALEAQLGALDNEIASQIAGITRAAQAGRGGEGETFTTEDALRELGIDDGPD